MAVIFGGVIIYWEVNSVIGKSTTTGLVLINLFMAIILVLLCLSYSYFLRTILHYLYGEILIKERNRFALVYGAIVTFFICQVFYFEAIQTHFFC